MSRGLELRGKHRTPSHPAQSSVLSVPGGRSDGRVTRGSYSTVSRTTSSMEVMPSRIFCSPLSRSDFMPSSMARTRIS